MFYSRSRRGQQVCDRIAADCLATAASRCAVASCVLRRQMFRSLKQCVKQSCPPQEEQQGDMLLFINSNAFSPHRRGRAALFLSLREEVELNSLRYMWHLALCHLCMFVGVCLCVCTHIETDYTLIRVAKMLLKSSNFDPWALQDLSSSRSSDCSRSSSRLRICDKCTAALCVFFYRMMICQMSSPIFVSFYPIALRYPSSVYPNLVYNIKRFHPYCLP